MSITNINNWVQIIPRTNYLAEWEIQVYLKRMLGADRVTNDMVKLVKSREISLYLEGMDLLTSFCRSTGIAPIYWGKEGWESEQMRVWYSLHWDKIVDWCIKEGIIIV